MSAGKTRRAGLLGLCALALAGSSTGSAQDSKHSQKEISEELARMYAEDHQDQSEWNDDSRSDYFSRRQTVRAQRANQIVAAGQLDSLEDWQNACWLLQHGDGADDFLLAHVLSVPPGVKGLPFAGFASAATLDRFLQNIERPQIFLTQSGSGDPAVFDPLPPFDDSLPESIRKAYNLAPLKHAASEKGAKKKDGAKSGKAPSAKELTKLLQAATQASATEAASTEATPAPDWLLRTREIVAAGVLKSDDDYALATRVLLTSSEPEDLLLAHVLATAAGLLGHEEGLPLTARTLDRFLIACDRPQLFGTVQAADASPPPTLLHETLRERYGLTARAGKR
jgi:hypothetical protein